MERSLEIVSIGTELLLGDVVDTNSPFAGRKLAALGVSVARHHTVADNAAEIASVIAGALARSGIVMTTGGLGPTRDDITRDTVAALLQMPLEFDGAVWQDLVQRWQRAGREIDPSNRCQAMVPTGGTVLRNKWGSAPGLWVDSPLGLVVMLPGVPLEFEGLLETEVIPRLEARLGTARITSRILRTTGIPESRLGSLLGPIEDQLQPVTMAYLPDQTGVDLRLTAWKVSEADAAQLLDHAEKRIRELAGQWIYATGRVDLAGVILERCRSRQVTVALAESCTGGMLGQRLTSIPGSSDVLLGGVISYANSAKEQLLKVPAGLLEQHGAVSSEVAQAMARGAAATFGAGLGVSITGVAGPGGGSEAKPVGLVWIGWSFSGRSGAREHRFTGDRTQIRVRACQAALLAMMAVLGD